MTTLNRNILIASCVALTSMLSAAPQQSIADSPDAIKEAQQAFNGLFGDKLQAVLRTRSTDDNIALARELLAATSAAENTPAFFRLLCDKAYETALVVKTDKVGFVVAANAMMRLADHLPDARLDALEKLIDVRQRQFNAAAATEKSDAGRDLIIALRSSARQNATAGNYQVAITHQRRAMGAARQIKSDDANRIRDDLVVMQAQQRLKQHIEKLESRVLESTSDVVAAEELSEIYLIQNDDIKAATKLAPRLRDAALINTVRLVSKRYHQLNETEAHQLAKWYDAFARNTSKQTPTAVRRAAYYYTRFLELHIAADTARITATLRLDLLKKTMTKLGIESITPEPDPAAVVAKSSADKTETAPVKTENPNALTFEQLFKGPMADPKKGPKIKKTEKGFELSHSYIWSPKVPGNGTFAATVKYGKQLNGFNFAAIHLRGGPGGTSYQFAFFPNRKKAYLQSIKGNKLLATLKEVDVEISNEPFALAFAASGKKLTVTVNGKPLIDVEDEQFVRDQGAVIVQTYNSEVEFQNARYIPAVPLNPNGDNTAVAKTDGGNTTANASKTSNADDPVKPGGPRKSIFDFGNE